MQNVTPIQAIIYNIDYDPEYARHIEYQEVINYVEFITSSRNVVLVGVYLSSHNNLLTRITSHIHHGDLASPCAITLQNRHPKVYAICYAMGQFRGINTRIISILYTFCIQAKIMENGMMFNAYLEMSKDRHAIGAVLHRHSRFLNLLTVEAVANTLNRINIEHLPQCMLKLMITQENWYPLYSSRIAIKILIRSRLRRLRIPTEYTCYVLRYHTFVDLHNK